MNGARISSVVIAGGGTAGWMAAAALSRFTGPGVQITLVESDVIGTVGVGEATIPQIQLFNAGLGIDERDFLKATQGTIKLGIEFAGWTRPGEAYMHAFGGVGRAAGIVPFHHFWLRARAERLSDAPFGAYAANELAARAGRFGRSRAPGAAPDLVAAYHFDAGLYAAFLRRFAERRRVVRIEGRIARVKRKADGDVACLHLDGDRRIDGDLFIDCTGFRSLLVGEALGENFVDWSNYLPCDRAMAVPCARNSPVRPYTTSTARSVGWQWRIPLQHRTGNGQVYCSNFISDDEVAATLLTNLDGEADGDPRPLRFRAGHRSKFWSHNCVALGLSAGFLEPLESTSIHLIQSGIARLLTLFPRRGHDTDTLRDDFNRQSAFEWERIRDFILLHYKANGRIGEPFWDAMRAAEIPDTLATKLATFERTGRIIRENEELFTEQGWSQVMIGQGVETRDWHPLADEMSAKELGASLTTMRNELSASAAHIPIHDEFLSSYLAA